MYSKKVLNHFMNPRNTGEIKNPDVKITEGSLACGDMLTLYMKIDPKSHKIKKIKFKSYGCAANIATTSMMTELVKGKKIEYAKKLTFADIQKALGGLPTVKVHCSVLAIDGLKSAIRSYEEKHGLVKKEPLDESLVRTRLRRVIYPKTGKDIVSMGILDKIKLGKNSVEIKLNMEKGDQFSKNVEEEVRERLESIVKNLKIKFGA
jgi:NifU-like protein involved in Fe-S cluster formation/metal-sulfur cluster biosynthetic enzyme